MAVNSSSPKTRSAASCRAATVARDWRTRRGPSKLKGRVTTATARWPAALAALRTSGEAPPPVPPPAPQMT